MNAWSDYLRGQAVIADRYSKSMTTPMASGSSPKSLKASEGTPTPRTPNQPTSTNRPPGTTGCGRSFEPFQIVPDIANAGDLRAQ